MFVPQEIIRIKRDGGTLSREAMQEFFGGYLRGDIPDYQVSALLMAITLKGMSFAEAVALTEIARDSGTCLQWDFPRHLVVDKHSTGGIGDKTSLILLPLAVLEGVRVPMISGRGLGHTGGTLDKLESIPGMSARPNLAQARSIMREHGGVFMGQTPEIAALDQRLYALRDVTATVESIPLITASILSKKLAAGLGGLVMDVKYGSGAFMSNLADARELARHLVGIGQQCGVKVRAFLTSMDSPLGTHAGNALEVIESIDVLRGKGPADTRELSLTLACEMVQLAFPERAAQEIRKTLESHLANGRAFEKFCQIASAQGADVKALQDTTRMPSAKIKKDVVVADDAYVAKVDVRALGLAILAMGGGRRMVTDTIDPGVGLTGLRRVGSKLKRGDTLLTIHAPDAARLQEAERLCRQAYTLSDSPGEDTLILETFA